MQKLLQFLILFLMTKYSNDDNFIRNDVIEKIYVNINWAEKILTEKSSQQQPNRLYS